MDLQEKIKDLETKILAFQVISKITQLSLEQANLANSLADHLNSLREFTKKDINEEKETLFDDEKNVDSVPELFSKEPPLKRIIGRE